MDGGVLIKIGILTAGFLNLLNFDVENYMTNVVIFFAALIAAIIY